MKNEIRIIINLVEWHIIPNKYIMDMEPAFTRTTWQWLCVRIIKVVSKPINKDDKL